MFGMLLSTWVLIFSFLISSWRLFFIYFYCSLMKQLAPRNSAPESPPTRDTPHHHHHDHDIIVHGDRPPDPIKHISQAPFPEKMWQVCMFDNNLVRKRFVSSFLNPVLLNLFELEAHIKCGIFSGPTIQKIGKMTMKYCMFGILHRPLSAYRLLRLWYEALDTRPCQ